MSSPSPAPGRNNPRRAAQAARVSSEDPQAGAGAAAASAPRHRSAAAVQSGASETSAADSAVAVEETPASPGASAKAGTPAKASAPARRPGGKTAASSAPRRRWPVALTVVLLAVVLVVGLLVGGFSYVRWFAHDDAADIQGTWYLAGTDTPIEITADRICLTDDVSYPYTLNTGDKTIAFSFSNLAGTGWYRFSLDRGQLAIEDGTFTGGDTLGRDIAWLPQALIAQLQGSSLAPAESAGKGLTLLSRTPSSGKAAASSKDAGGDDDTSSSSPDDADASAPEADEERGDSGDGAFDEAATDKDEGVDAGSSLGSSGESSDSEEGTAPADDAAEDASL